MKQFILILLLLTMGCRSSKQKPTLKPQSKVEHVVFFWAKDGTESEIIDSIKAHSLALDTIPGIISLSMGTPLQSDRPMVDDSFTLGLIFSFPDKESMASYVKHPGHTKFIEKWIKPNVEKLLIYDIEK